MLRATLSRMASDPTGQRFHIGTADVLAEITEVGATLRALRVRGVDLIPPYPNDMAAPAASGTVLVPWPGRVRDGAWTQRGETYQLAITEPKFQNASHGLLRFAPYRVAAHTADALTLTAAVVPQTGYPFHLHTSVTYAIVDDGVHVTHEIVNVGTAEAPVALGTHPYFFISDTPTADLALEIDARTWFPIDERNLPLDPVPVDANTDVREPRRVGDLSLDAAYTDVTRDSNDRIRGVLHAPDGRRLELWAGADFAYLQAFTTDRYPGQHPAIAIEPMTAPADALNSGRGLRWIEPGASWSLEWGVSFNG